MGWNHIACDYDTLKSIFDFVRRMPEKYINKLKIKATLVLSMKDWKKNINRINSYQENKLFIMIIVICEEISYRLFILDAGVRIFENIPIACCVSAVLYALNHLSIIFKTKIKLYWFASRLLLGLLLSLIALKGGLLFSILLHYLYNFFINHVIPGYSEKITEKRWWDEYNNSYSFTADMDKYIQHFK